MRKLLTLVLSCLFFLTSCKNDIELKVISFNIRYDTERDGNNAWPGRKELALQFLEDQAPDIFGLQEALWHQYSYIDSCLTGYASVGAGRDDGDRKGEMNPVFYKKDRFELLVSNTFWLSETPGIPGSKGWGAALPRIVTWVKLKEKKSGKELFYFNTHFSHMSDSARVMSARILREQVYDIAGESNFVVSGDFNMLPESEAYAALTAGEANPVSDCYLISETGPEGVEYTFNGFKDAPGSGRIDYIFTRPGSKVHSFRIHSVKNDGIFISDHWPVESLISLKF
ncbi:MAG: endonuclease/exonuclease/phosphatase family protein [Marinilabiliaceae bacterium]|jgi:endonuclease/exonuclease/phosphatase family metal-dependent hydrolase|nr:endonuclease/exonuclease/phosphatase family protein [Marinilabiliaceae bacterium]